MFFCTEVVIFVVNDVVVYNFVIKLATAVSNVATTVINIIDIATIVDDIVIFLAVTLWF